MIDTDRLKQQQDREHAERNAETLRAWYRATFGEVVGKVLADEHIAWRLERK